MAALAPEYEWTRVWRDGVLLLQQATSGRVRLPADWISLQNGLQPKPADGFPPEFGYNSLRIPLYLLRAGMTEMEWLRALKQRWSAENEGVAVVNVVTGQVRERLTDQGYAMLPAAARLRARRDADSGAAEDLRAEPLLSRRPCISWRNPCSVKNIRNASSRQRHIIAVAILGFAAIAQQTGTGGNQPPAEAPPAPISSDERAGPVSDPIAAAGR